MMYDYQVISLVDRENVSDIALNYYWEIENQAINKLMAAFPSSTIVSDQTFKCWRDDLASSPLEIRRCIMLRFTGAA